MRVFEFENLLATSFVPWTSITVVRSNRETLAFFRDNTLMGYIPAHAFEIAGSPGIGRGFRTVVHKPTAYHASGSLSAVIVGPAPLSPSGGALDSGRVMSAG